MTSSGGIEFPISSVGFTFVNKTISTDLPLVNGSASAILRISLVSKRPFSPEVHLHSPMRICFPSIDSAMISSIMFLEHNNKHIRDCVN